MRHWRGVSLCVVGLLAVARRATARPSRPPGRGCRRWSSSAIRSAWATRPRSPSGSRARPSSSACRRTAATAPTCSSTSTSGSSAQKPDVVHLNCGLHDLKRSKNDGHHQVELDRYEENLRRIVARIREGTDAALVFADTTPILDDRHARAGRGLRPDRGRRAAVQRRGRRGHGRARRAGPRPALGRRAGRPGDDARPRRHALHRRRLRSARRGGRRLRAAAGDGPPLSAPAAAGRPGRGRRGVPQGRSAERDALVPKAYRRAQGPASSASRRTPPPGRSSGRRCSGPVVDRSATCRPGPRRREPGSSPASSGRATRWRRSRIDNGVDGEVTAPDARPRRAGRGRCRRSSGCTPRRPTRRR